MHHVIQKVIKNTKATKDWHIFPIYDSNTLGNFTGNNKIWAVTAKQ